MPSTLRRTDTVSRLLLASLLLTTSLAAQSTPPAFEVVSVKPSAGGRSLLPTVKGRQLAAINVPVRPIIRMAYGRLTDGTLQQLQNTQILGAPDWVDVDRFDILATMPEGPRASGDLQLMIRRLLTDRFGLRTHTERRPLPVYTLAMARTDRAPGPALKSSPPECGAATDTSAPCGFRAGPGKIAGRGPIGLLTAATALGQFLDRPLIDRTGLTGNFEVSLQWTPTPDQIPDRLRGNTSVDLRPTQLDIPSLFAALQEQLGLKLEPETAPIDVLVIDRIELPTAN